MTQLNLADSRFASCFFQTKAVEEAGARDGAVETRTVHYSKWTITPEAGAERTFIVTLFYGPKRAESVAAAGESPGMFRSSATHCQITEESKQAEMGKDGTARIMDSRGERLAAILRDGFLPLDGKSIMSSAEKVKDVWQTVIQTKIETFLEEEGKEAKTHRSYSSIADASLMTPTGSTEPMVAISEEAGAGDGAAGAAEAVASPVSSGGTTPEPVKVSLYGRVTANCNSTTMIAMVIATSAFLLSATAGHMAGKYLPV